ncbi:glycosyltransferase [Actinomycetospora sp. NBC_00405]|uniref:glycosyltransferase n=1 Tax=Actinomycetospora sp. NBC_00405 TaxID=2975952 RepID=UPI002E1C2D87
MHVLIMAVGSTGDVAPYTGLGARLRQAGHEVAIAAAASFAGMVTAAELEHRVLPGDPRAAQQSEANRRWQRRGRGVRSGAEMTRLLARHMRELGDGMIAAAEQNTDVVLLSGPAYLGGADVAEGLGLPSAGVFAAPAHPTREFPPLIGLPDLGPTGNWLAGRAVFAGMSPILAPAIRHIRSTLGLAPRSFRRAVRAHDRARWPVRYGVSPLVVPRPHDWRPGLEMAGYFWPHHGAWTPPTTLREFLDAGPPPVAVSFGSMAPRDPQLWSALIADALRHAGLRGVVQAGWAELEVREEHVLTVGDVPHTWLLPRVAALVHHSGAGTTAAALRAGVPTVPVPIAADQHFWAARQVALGVAPARLEGKGLTADALAAAIRAAVGDPEHRLAAGRLAARLEGEDGATEVVRLLPELASTRP